MKAGIYVLGILLVFFAGVLFDRYICKKAIKSLKRENNKFWEFFYILEQWLSNKENGVCISDYIMQKGCHNVAIYGMSVLGNLLYTELKNSSQISVDYAIDRNAEEMYFEVNVIGVDEDYPDTDVIIVTAISEFENIKKFILKKKKIDIISLEDVIYGAAEMASMKS